MISIRIHGRGGQGTVALAELIALAAFKEGLQAQSLPFFGVERSGAPVKSFVRIDKENIISNSQIYQPQYLIIQDDSLLARTETVQGIDNDSKILVNTEKSAQEIKKLLAKEVDLQNIVNLDANQISFSYIRKQISNTALLGAFAAKYKIFSQENAKFAIAEKFKNKGRSINKLNQKIFLSAYEKIKSK